MEITNKFDELFDKHIEEGLIISTPRGCGKTTWMLKKAVELAEKNTGVEIIVTTPHLKERLKKLLRKNSLKQLLKFKLKNYLKTRKNLCVTYFPEQRKETQYKFYDEPFGQIMQQPFNLFIGTIRTPNHFRFDKSWVEKNKLKEIKRRCDGNRFREEYENNIITKEDD